MYLYLLLYLPPTGNAIGSLAAGSIIDRWGTKKSLWGLCLASVAAIAIQVWTHSRGQLLAGKILNGIPQGAFVAVAASKFSSIAAALLRRLTFVFSQPTSPRPPVCAFALHCYLSSLS